MVLAFCWLPIPIHANSRQFTPQLGPATLGEVRRSVAPVIQNWFELVLTPRWRFGTLGCSLVA